MCDLVLEEIKNDLELQQISSARLDDRCYEDTGLHLLTQDVVYFGSKNPLTSDMAADDWCPPLEEYNPHPTKDDWKKYILEIELPDHPTSIQMLKAMMELGGKASCKQLSQIYGGSVIAYVDCAGKLSKRVKKYFNLSPFMDGAQEKFFLNRFLGKNLIEDGVKNYCFKIRPELFEALQEMDLSHISARFEEDEEEDEVSESTRKTDVNKNTILYGPPGTGKTYYTVLYAVAIIENKLLADIKDESYSDVLERYNAYKADGLIEFTTFHQSYGYEEFIEGIKPVMDNTDDEHTDIQYQISSGLFKSFCDKAGRLVLRQAQIDIGLNNSPTIWKVSLEGTGDNPTRKECMEKGHIRVGYDKYGKDITGETDFVHGGKSVLNAFISKMKIGDIVLSCYSATTIDAIGVVTGEYEWHDEYDHYKRLRKVNWIVKDITEDITEINGGYTMTLSTVYKLNNIALPDVMDIISREAPASIEVEEKKKNYGIAD